MTKKKYGKVTGDRTIADIEQRRRDRWNFLFIAGMWFQDLFNYDFRRTEMCIIPYATQQGEISFCAYNTGVGWRNIIEKMHMTATLTKWYEEHGRHEIFAGGKKVGLETTAHTLKLVDEQLLNGLSESARASLRPILVRPLMQAYGVIVKPTEAELNRVWMAQVRRPRCPLRPGHGRRRMSQGSGDHPAEPRGAQGIPPRHRFLFGVLRERPQDADRPRGLGWLARLVARSAASAWELAHRGPPRRGG